MINNYEIRTANGEEILFLYLDFNDEFAKFNFKEKTEKLETIIKKFIKDNKIDFKGTKVAIVVGGIAIGTLLFNQPVINTNNQTINDNNITITETVQDSNIIEKNENQEIIENDNTIIEDKTEVTTDISSPSKGNVTITNNQVQNVIQEKLEENIKIEQSKSTYNENIQTKPVENTHTNESNNKVTEESTQVEEKEETEELPVQDIKTYITIHRTNGTVITLELEEYLIGVVGAEMPASFHEQALMSQAIIARTYALKAIERNTKLTDNSSTQNYRSNEELRNTWGSNYNYYYTKVKRAVENTKGMYLTYNGILIDAVYHSTSNGTTEDSKNVWGNSFPYLVSVESKYDSSNKSFEKEKFISYQELSEKLNMEITIETNFNILGYTSGNRIENIEINGNIYTGVKIRNLLGLRSTDFNIKKSDTGVTFITRGYGHGVGLSQYGANGMANNGYTYSQILKHYYQGVVINHL